MSTYLKLIYFQLATCYSKALTTYTRSRTTANESIAVWALCFPLPSGWFHWTRELHRVWAVASNWKRAPSIRCGIRYCMLGYSLDCRARIIDIIDNGGVNQKVNFQCQKRGLDDYAQIGGSPGLDNTNLIAIDSVCGLDSKAGQWDCWVCRKKALMR